MKPAAIVAPSRSLAEIASQWDSLVGKEQRTVAEFKAQKAKLLIEARTDPKWGARGDGFVDFVEKRLKIDYATAHRWMTAAGWKPPKQAGAGRKENHSHSENERHDSDKRAGDEDGSEPETEEEIDPENYRTAFALRASEAVKFATGCKTLARDIDLTPDLLSLARQAAVAWSNLVSELENAQ